MSQHTMHPSGYALAFTQGQSAFIRGEDRELRKLRRENSFLSWRNLLGMIRGVGQINTEYLMYLLMAVVFSPFIMFGAARLAEGIGVIVPVAVSIVLSAVLPLGLLGMFMAGGVDKKMAAKRKVVASARRAVELLDRNDRPVLTTEHVLVRERLDELFLSGRVEMPMSECVAQADDVFALVLEDFSLADDVLRIVETRGVYSAVQVRVLLDEMRDLPKPLQEGAL